jgi:cardiolipin synthase
MLTKKDKTKRKYKRPYIPFRFLLAVLIMLVEVAAVVGIIVYGALKLRYVAILSVAVQIICAIRIVNSDDNPDYKVPWLFFVMLIPVVGFMLYIMFYSRRLSYRQQRRTHKLLKELKEDLEPQTYPVLQVLDPTAHAQVVVLNKLSHAKLCTNTAITYYPTGEELFQAMLEDVKKAERFIFLEYFIVDEGELWDSILEVLKQKVKEGVEVRLLYDDVGCMWTISSMYFHKLRNMGIRAVPFGVLRGQANNEFNNRDHRKMTIIDGKVAYTGGANIGDEYVNVRERYGYWKDNGIRLEGAAVNEFTRLFLANYESNVVHPDLSFDKYYVDYKVADGGFCVPFGDGPRPLYKRQVSKTLILSMLNNARHTVTITTPYLIIDNELAQALENAALRGVDVKIITPHIPDKRIVFLITRSYYPRLLDAGVKILEFERGFIHAKTYLVDGKYAMVGSINLDYRSLVHHFENGVYICGHSVIEDIAADLAQTEQECIPIEKSMLSNNIFIRLLRSLVKIFAPLF